MTKQAKNYQRLRHIVEYCEKIKVAAEVFNNSYDTFADDKNIKHETYVHSTFSKSANLSAG